MNKVNNFGTTYRVQLHKDFNFQDLAGIADYLQQLGVGALYASPVFESMPGSTHGYDGTNPNKINPEIGTKEELVALSQSLKQKSIAWLQDIVPNHLSFHEKNTWLMDVLAKGKASEYATFFDIIWDHPDYGNKLMVPFPGSPLEQYLRENIPAADHYVVTDWKETDKRINYRRFFTVNSLIFTNVHDDQVFTAYHRLIGELIADNTFDGLRVDHIDGLFNPQKYLRQLRSLAGEHIYVVVEKILEPDENMPDDWDVQGTSGYEFLGMVNNLLTYHGAAGAFDELYADITGDDIPVPTQVHEKKSYILFNHMSGELDNLVRLYKNCGGGEGMSDEEIRKAIGEYLVSCPVYRYYGKNIPFMPHDESSSNELLPGFYQRAMQFTGPLMAKGVEDTLMYTYNRFIGHNEVGDAPQAFGISPAKFHSLMQYRQQHWPLSLNTSSTHDTKRGEDARARLNALTAFSEEWVELVKKWQAGHQSLKKNAQPDANDEYFIYQSLVASFPFPTANGDNEVPLDYPQRITEYLQKALREAKLHSNWADTNTAYEEAAISFAKALINGDNDFHQSFIPFLQRVADYGIINSLSQLLLKFTCPGIPDTYQGTELWDFSLVDPDNRRPVDYQVRKELLARNQPFYELWATRNTGHIKLALTQKLLSVRNAYMELFSGGTYTGLEIEGVYKNNAVAFIRSFEGRNMLVAAPLHLSQVPGGLLQEDWQDTKIILPSGFNAQWKDLLKNSVIKDLFLTDVFKQFPVALLVNQ